MILDMLLYTPLLISLIWSLILFLSARSNQANSVLAVFMLNSGLLFLSHLVFYTNHRSFYLNFDLMFIFCSLAIFPLYYLYIKTLTYESKVRKRDFLIFIPSVAVLAITTIIYWLMPETLRKEYISNYIFSTGNFANAPFLIRIQLIMTYILQVVYAIQIIVFYLKIKKFITNFNQTISNFYSDADNKILRWPRIIFNSFAAISFISIFANFLGRAFFAKSLFLLAIPSISYSLFLFVLGYLGDYQLYSIKNYEVDEKEPEIALPTSNENDERKKNQNTGNKMKQQLLSLFEEKKWHTFPDLKITDVAAELNTNRTYISLLINDEFETNFNCFVNQYRVEEAKKLLSNTDSLHYSLDYVCHEAGFGSLNSLNRVFKESVGMTPGMYRNSIHQSSEPASYSGQ